MPRQHPPLPGTVRHQRGQSLTDDELARLDQLLNQQPITGLTDAAIAKIIPCARQTVWRRRRHLQGEALDAERAAAGEAPRQAPEAPESASDLLSQYADIATLAPSDTMRLLSILALTCTNEAARINALSTLERLRADIAPPDERAPKPPLTLEEKVQRTMQILDAAGIEVTQRAISQLWPDA